MIATLVRTAWTLHWLTSCLLVCAAHASQAPPLPTLSSLSETGDIDFVPAAANLPGVVLAITQDQQGFVWLGTGSGLFRWDGYRSVIAASAAGTDSTWSGGRINALTTDGRGKVWAASDHGLVRQDPTSGNFVMVRPARSDADIPMVLHADAQGSIWVATEQDLLRLDTASGLPMPGVPAIPTEHQINAVLLDRAGTLWVGTSQGLLRMTKGATVLTTVPLAQPPFEGEPSILALTQDSSGRIWACGSHAGVYVQAANNSDFTPLRAVQEVYRGTVDTVTNAVEVQPGEMWLGMTNSGVLRVDLDRGRYRLEQHTEGRQMSLRGNAVRVLARGTDDKVWVSTEGGIAFHSSRSSTIRTISSGNAAWQLRSNEVWAVLQKRDGAIWLGDRNGGIELLDEDFRSLGRRQVLDLKDAPPGKTLAIRHMAEAPDGSVWIASELGVHRVADSNRTPLRVASSDNGLTQPARRIVWIDSAVYVGGVDALRRYRVTTTGAAVLERRWSLAQQVSYFHVAANGAAILVGTTKGLYELDAATAQLKPVDPVPRGRNPKGYISSILELPNGAFWVSGFGRGIVFDQLRASGTTTGYRRLGMRDGLLHDSVDCMLFDAFGTVWISTDEGLVRINPRDLSMRNFHRFRHQGLGQPTYWAGSCARTPLGEMLFGGSAGLTIVQPQALDRAPPPPPVLTELSVDGTVSHPQGGSASTPLKLSAGARKLTAEFAALGAEDPEDQSYSYRLLGYEDEWTDTPATRRLASFANLPPGKYELQLRTRAADSAWSDATALPVEVAPAWFERSAVRVSFAALVAGAVLAIVQLRTFYLRRRAIELAHAVQVGTEELQFSQKALQKLAYFDSLTELPNRNHLMESLQQRMDAARDRHCLVGVLFIDLDRFKWVNDSFGHAVGDQVLRQVAERIHATVADVAESIGAFEAPNISDLVARFGSDEYVVILPALPSADAAYEVAQRLQRRFAHPFQLPCGTVFCGASIGISIYPQDGQEADELLVRADMAMYKAKVDGRNQIVRFSPALDRRSRRRTEVAGMVATAREENRLRLHYQPIVNLPGGEVIGYEALMRMINPHDNSLVSPLEFITVAEELGVIQSLGLWAIERVLQMLRDWPDSDPHWPAPKYISVNVSALQLLDGTFPSQVSALLRTSGVAPQRLVLELTESCLMDTSESTLACIQDLHELGLKLSIDDFGTGYSSLSSIKNFPFSTLKIDRIFVRDVATDLAARQLVAAIIAIAAVYDLDIVAEGVEDEAQARALCELAPHARLCGQGYLYGRPVEVVPEMAPPVTAIPRRNAAVSR